MVTVSAVESELLANARALAPLIREHADENERARRLSPVLVRALQDAGVMRMTMPRVLGGLEAHPLVQFEVLEALSIADASTGWCGYIGGSAGWFSAYLDPAVAREMFPNPDVINGGGARPTGRALTVEGGYLVSGRWPFGSGCHHADWLGSSCIVYDSEQPRLDEAGRQQWLMCFLPASAYTILDNWTTTGLRGSGSNDYVTDGVFCPAERTINLFTSTIRVPGPLYAYRRMFLLNHAAVALGVGRAAIEALIALAGSKKAFGSGGLREEGYVQNAVARAEMLVGSARGYIFTIVDEIWQTLVKGEAVSDTQNARFRLAILTAHENAVEAVNLMFHAGGGSSIYTGNPLDRLLRDMHTINQHAVVSPKTTEVAGRLLLELSAGVASF